MGQNILKLNADKTQLIWLGTRQQLAKLTIEQLKLTTSTVEFDAEANDLGCPVGQSAVDGLTYSSYLPILLLPDASAEVC